MLAVRGRDSYELLADVNFLDTESEYVSHIVLQLLAVFAKSKLRI